jgi:hypothetical protein
MLSAMPATQDRGMLRRYAVWCALLVMGLLLRLWFLQHQMTPDDDSDVYAELASNLFHHGIYGIATNGVIDPTLIRLPGYPLFLALIFRLFGWGNFNAVLLVQIGCDLLSCWLVASFVREGVSMRAGTIALGLAALCPFTAAYSTMALTECLSVFAVSLGLWAAGRILRAQAAGKKDLGAMLWASLAMAMAMLLRPDGVLVAIMVAAAIGWYAARQGSVMAGMKTALLCCLLAGLPLVPWAVRNWRTFHAIQPLAPRRVNDPGEYVTYGFYRWMNTWSVDIVSTGAVFWNLGSDTIDVNDLPSRAFDSETQRARTAELLAEYNVQKTITPELDARFAELAKERVRKHPVLCLVWVPSLRVALDLKPDWWRFQSPLPRLFELIVLGLMNVGLVFLAVVALARRCVPWVALAVIYLGLRCALLSTMENSEPRYTLEALPILIACSACSLGGRRTVDEANVITLSAQPLTA